MTLRGPLPLSTFYVSLRKTSRGPPGTSPSPSSLPRRCAPDPPPTHSTSWAGPRLEGPATDHVSPEACGKRPELSPITPWEPSVLGKLTAFPQKLLGKRPGWPPSGPDPLLPYARKVTARPSLWSGGAGTQALTSRRPIGEY